MPFAQIDEGVRLSYELTGPDERPIVLQFGGGLFGRHNFGLVNDGFREQGFRLLSFDARGYGASSSPREEYSTEGWAADGAALLDAVGLERVFVHGTSMGGIPTTSPRRRSERASWRARRARTSSSSCARSSA
jgi:3-oxoadipate enol-lactonase/4-carboxymuconolactone decarboxylase